MRITTRVATGLLLMASLLIGTLAYQLSQVGKLQEINRELSLVTLEAARISVRLLQGLEPVREFAAKTALLGDPDYQSQWVEWEAAVNTEFGRLAVVGLTAEEEAIRRRMVSGWNRYRAITPDLLDDPARRLPELEAVLAELRDETEALIAANEAVVAERAQASAEAAEEARSVAWLAAGGALALAGMLSLLVYLSIASPLRRFTRGTREIARGRFTHRMELEGPGEFRGLGSDFNRMAEQLGELEAMKEEFVSHVSHELKTPLAAIHETIEIFLDEIPGPLTAKQVHLLELSRKSSHRLASMISDLLEISRLEAGVDGYEPAWCDFTEIVRSTVEELSPLATERGLSVSLHLPEGGADIVCDPRRISEVVSNLVGNAAKFSPEGGAVRVHLAKLDRLPPGIDPLRSAEGVVVEPPFFLLTVQDEGPGIADRHKNAVFDKFHQVSGRERLRGQGVGLGLAIARRITGGHGGAIWVEDAEGGGATFRVILPARSPNWAGRVSSEPRSPEPEPDPSRVGSPAQGTARSGALLGALVLAGLTGCASLPFVGSSGDPGPAEATAQGSYSSEFGEGEISLPSVAERLDGGWSFLEARSFGEAFQEFREVLANEPARALQAEAHWGLALIHLRSEGPLGDPEWADASLATLEEDFADTRYGIQAVWVRGLLRELAQVRSVVADQEAILRQLTETVELLKAIDLNRRPPRPPPDGPRREGPPPGSAIDPV